MSPAPPPTGNQLLLPFASSQSAPASVPRAAAAPERVRESPRGDTPSPSLCEGGEENSRTFADRLRTHMDARARRDLADCGAPGPHARAQTQFLRAAQEREGLEVRRVRVEFRPFRATLYSFRISPDGTARLKFHRVFELAPDEVLYQAARLMLCRRRRDRARVERRAYDEFVRALPPGVFDLPGARRATWRARPGPGRVHSLEESFARVNARYFQGHLSRPGLCWSPRAARRVLGTYQERSDRVIVSRRLDAVNVPLFVLDYLMYHELLHKFLGPRRHRDGRRNLHGAEFKRLERRFEKLTEARKWLRKL